MNIAFDGTIWGGQERGVAAATRRLFFNLAADRRGHRLVAFASRGWTSTDNDLHAGSDRVRTARIPGGRAGRILWQQFMLPRRARAAGADVLVCPCYTAPIFSSIPSVVVVHDLIAWKRPDLCPWTNILHLRALVGRSVRRAARVVVPTNVVQEDVRTILKVPDGKIDVIPWGVDSEIRRVEPVQAREMVREDFGVTAPFALFAGCLERKKNVERFVEAARMVGVFALLAGPSADRTIERAVRASACDGVCRYLGYLTARQLSALYSACAAFVFPSHIEGFGLPVVEAMSCGAPVIASDAPALVEVCGGAAMHVPAEDTNALADAMRRVISDTAVRASLMDRGRVRAAEFTWRRTADLFWRVLEGVIE